MTPIWVPHSGQCFQESSSRLPQLAQNFQRLVFEMITPEKLAVPLVRLSRDMLFMPILPSFDAYRRTRGWLSWWGWFED